MGALPPFSSVRWPRQQGRGVDSLLYRQPRFRPLVWLFQRRAGSYRDGGFLRILFTTMRLVKPAEYRPFFTQHCRVTTIPSIWQCSRMTFRHRRASPYFAFTSQRRPPWTLVATEARGLPRRAHGQSGRDAERRAPPPQIFRRLFDMAW